ncbi:family 20 glycosylhydrolase [Cohnella hashimotonis]|uniref:beta-N-acetylhexosaminidase n=1 Tax=Cohnella hashimotonis TaxID=2826895 RepID=A0ABT6TKT1_9BACL|nr:family 20 glycosylhydrolase [Cohnella hashimotonis]MDI4647466.1 family 20 glycosylhydrolase [Cohnella hashimotonis]
MIEENMLLVPHPQQLLYTEGEYALPREGRIRLPSAAGERMTDIAKRAQRLVRELAGSALSIVCDGVSAADCLRFEREDRLPPEGYHLEIGRDGMSIVYKDEAGAFHAVSTLKQILWARRDEASLPCLRISDYPDFAARGIMLDISRDRIPTLATLYRVVDLMADLKLNQLQLYIEGFSYAYPSFPDVWEAGTPIAPEEIRQLSRYCADRFIDLVPNQNSFGHMTPWLIRDEFNALAECPDGCEAPWGRYHPTTFNPVDPAVFGFLERTFDDLLPAFSSDYFNVGCDETFELGQGQSQAECERRGKGIVYLDYLLNLNALVGKKGKKMMFWAEIIAAYPELIERLPKDLIALEWGYSADDPDPAHCETLMKHGIPYYVCPGTSSWNTIGGLTDNMKSNLRNAALRGKQFGAIGFLNTDWGSPHHWHHLPISYPGFVYGAALSWSVDRNIDADIAAYLDRFVFLDRNNRLGQFALDLGNYYLQEQKTNFDGSGTFRTLYYHQLTDTNRDLDRLALPDLTRSDFKRVAAYVSALREELAAAAPACDDAALVIAEYENAVALILHGTELGLYKHAAPDDTAARKARLSAMLRELAHIKSDYERIWLSRNRPGGMKESLVPLDRLAGEYQEALKGLELA